MKRFLLVTAILFLMGGSFVQAQEAPARKYSNVARLNLERLKATHDDVVRFQATRIVQPPVPGLTDYRCIMHAHAEDSTHTGGTLPEMLADAKKAGIHAILLTDHYRPPRDFIDGRWRGIKEGVLFIPGSEIRGFLIYPMKSILSRMELKVNEFIETVNADEGMIFLSHIEERKDHSMEGLTGLEIYNRHWDAKRDMGSLIAVAMKLTDPIQLVELQKAVELYPHELFAFQCDYPSVYLKKWDDGTKTKRLTGVAANDCHHNQVMVVKMVDEKNALVGTMVDEDKSMRKVSTDLRPGLKELMKGHKPGDVIAKVDIDPYAVSFKNSVTHILASSLDETSIRAALKAGHAFVSHDWICDASGFHWMAIPVDGKQTKIMGDEVAFSAGLILQARLPAAAYVRVIHNGTEVAKYEAHQSLKYEVKQPGAYRLEAWVKLDGEYRPWIYSNPIYVK